MALDTLSASNATEIDATYATDVAWPVNLGLILD